MGVSNPTIQKWIHAGYLQVQRQGRRWLVSQESLVAQRQRFGSQATSGHMTVEAAAAQFHIARLRLERAIRKGDLPTYYLGESRYWRHYVKPADVESWLKATDWVRKPIETPPRRCPPGSPSLFTLEEASKLARRSSGRLRQAIRSGALVVTREFNRTHVSREALDNWLEKLYFGSGETDLPNTISLREASEQSQCSTTSLRNYVANGTLSDLQNPEGYPILDRSEFERWLKTRPPKAEALRQSGRLYSLKEISELVHIKLATVQKDVAKKLLPASLVAGRPPRWVVAEADFRTWLKKRNQRYTSAPLRGEELTTREVCERYGCTYDILKQGLRQGLLPVTRRFHLNGVGLVWGSQDVEEYFTQRAQDSSWTLTRITEFTGIHREATRTAMKQGFLKYHIEQHPAMGPRRVVEAADLVEWIETKAPPYRKEVAHLSPLVSSKAAGKLSQLGQSNVVRAIRENEMGAIELAGETGPRYFIPRLRLDLWLQKRGLPPSWVVESEAPWLRVEDAARLVAMAKPTIQKWLSLGHVRAKRRGRRWLVERQSLLEKARHYRGQGDSSLPPSIEHAETETSLPQAQECPLPGKAEPAPPQRSAATPLLAQKFRQCRREAGITQEQFGKLIGLEGRRGKITVSNWERGRSRPTLDHIEKCAGLIDRPLSWFFEDPPDSPAQSSVALLQQALRLVGKLPPSRKLESVKQQLNVALLELVRHVERARGR